MSKKPSLAAALQTFDRMPSISTPPSAGGRGHEHHRNGEGITVGMAPSRIGKKALIGYFDPAVSKQLKQMALDNDRTIQDLLAEALNDFFQKYKKPTIA